MVNKRYFFVLGMPRTRSAWLSVLLTDGAIGSFCAHEGGPEVLDDRQEPIIGDAGPGLLYRLDELLARFHDAPFLIVRRDPEDALRALLTAAPEHQRDGIARGWEQYLRDFEAAVLRIPNRREVTFAELQTQAACEEAALFLLGRPLEPGRWAQLRDLRITSTFPEANIIAPRKTLQVPDGRGVFDRSGLSAAVYQHEDFPMLAEWWKAHTDLPLARNLLPPLGVVVSINGKPAAAVWCYEIFGAPVAELTFPVARPGMPPADSVRALLYGALACMHAAGKAHVPEAQFCMFKVNAPLRMVRFLKQIGFVEYPTERTPLILTIPCPH